MRDDGIWFEPKRFGYGAGLPVAWQGWALLGGFLAVVLLIRRELMPQHHLLFVAVLMVSIGLLALLAARHTRGGWRWRWGSDA